MKKIVLLLVFLSIPSFAIYVDVGFGVGGASTEVDNKSVEKILCDDCDELAVSLGFRIGGKINERFWIAGEFGGVGDRYYDSDYVQFNTYLLGPSFIFYPVEHFQLSGSIGFAWTSNDTDVPGAYLYDGTGAAISLTAAYDTGINDGALIGIKLFSSSVELEESKKDLSTVGITFFIAYVHK